MTLLEKRFELSTTPAALDPIDPPPEFCHYRDEGCEMATRELGQPSQCARCPFPECLDEEAAGRQKWLKKLRNREILAQFSREGKTVMELARFFNISQRTVQRALKGTKNG